mmetsp:Transcript_14797/g.37459  ORF Transcript_14797/g.37459 Transcript_14797/m.37459 type:complete len:383 (-) Transcript_14797:221-1369(-)
MGARVQTHSTTSSESEDSGQTERQVRASRRLSGKPAATRVTRAQANTCAVGGAAPTTTAKASSSKLQQAPQQLQQQGKAAEGGDYFGASLRHHHSGVEKDDLLPFLDAEQDHLFLFPEDWHGNASFTFKQEASGASSGTGDIYAEEIDSLTNQILTAKNISRQMFGGKDYKVDDVDEALKQAGDLGGDPSLTYTLVRRSPDGKSARVATADDVKDLSRQLSAKAKVAIPFPNLEEAAASASASAAATMATKAGRGAMASSSGYCKHHQHQHQHQEQPLSKAETQRREKQAASVKRGGSQYKPGGPCDHCGVTESPQWRRGPPNKPQLCNACGTRYRRTSNLGPGTCGSAYNSRKRDLVSKAGKANKAPRYDNKSSLLVPVSA